MTAVIDHDITLKSKEESLRNVLSIKPQNAKVMSQLASLLVERSKTILAVHPKQAELLRNEAVEWAKHAIQIGPQRPFGYAALSVAARDWSERKQALLQAADLSPDQFRLARTGVLVRLLTEERDEESRNVTGTIGKASVKHPSRRALAASEMTLYHRIEEDLRVAWIEASTFSEKEQEFLSKQEFRLARFFRKKMPQGTSLPRARKHFMQCRTYASPNQGEMAAFWLATLPDDATPTSNVPAIAKCPTSYVVNLYSTFAARFDKLLVEQLQYQTPTKLRQLFDCILATMSENNKCFERVCDLGCGTGLSGLAFRDLVIQPQGSLVGVDLSSEMLEQAKVRGCYSELHVGDVETTLSKLHQTRRHTDIGLSSFDLILACDVFCYIGNLAGVFSVVATALDSAGYFCFSTELLLPSEDRRANASSPFRLHSCARFSHRQSYIEELGQKSGFETVEMRAMPIRKNQGQDVQGLLVVMQKI